MITRGSQLLNIHSRNWYKEMSIIINPIPMSEQNLSQDLHQLQNSTSIKVYHYTVFTRDEQTVQELKIYIHEAIITRG
jgi:CRISPR/Cas system endoribonuclease Cas6 (RAMP superfamily)